MKEAGTKDQRITIQYFDGLNSSVQQTIALKTELSHSENARAGLIGSLEKREGQEVIGTDGDGDALISYGDYGLEYFEDGGSSSKGLLRVSSINGIVANIYYLNQDDEWTIIDNSIAQGLSLVKCDFAKADDKLLIVNGSDENRLLSGSIKDVTVMSDADSGGSLYNSPIANKVAVYKGRIYLADYYNANSDRLKTTVLRSSYGMGIVCLLNGDLSAKDNNDDWVFDVTDTKYIYSDIGVNMNKYEIYRGNHKVADIEVGSFDETSMTAADANVDFADGYSTFLSSDEVWVKDTFSGEKKYRWISNSSSSGKDVKQYDTFKLSGGDEDAITLLEPIGNILMIANKNSIMTWNDYSLESFDLVVGCCSKNGYVKNKKLYMLHYSGIYATTGGAPALISRKVERYIKGATKSGLEAGAMGTKWLSIFATIGDVTLYNEDGSTFKTLSDVCLEYAINDEIWYVHTNVTAFTFKNYLDSTGTEKLTMNSYTVSKNSVLGTELITNGGFTDDSDPWVYGTGWDDSGDKMTLTNA